MNNVINRSNLAITNSAVGCHWVIVQLAVFLLVGIGIENRAVAAVNTAPSFFSIGKVTTDLRPTHRGQNQGSQGYSVAIQKDGKILVAGYSFGSAFLPSARNYGYVALARYLTDGRLDSSFGNNGTVTTDVNDGNGWFSIGYSMAIQTDGKILVAGNVFGAGFGSGGAVSDLALVRYNEDGSLDTTFDGDGKAIIDLGGYDVARSISIQANGKILVVGSSELSAFNLVGSRVAVLRFNRDGSLDTGFSGDGKLLTKFAPPSIGAIDEGSDVTVQADGKIIVTGVHNNGEVGVIRLNPNGSLDAGFDGDGKVTTSFESGIGYYIGSAVILQPDGKIIATGKSDFGVELVRYNPNGTLDNSFDNDGKTATPINSNVGDQPAIDVALQKDGKILVSIPSEEFIMFRYNADGTLDTSFSGDGIVKTLFPHGYPSLQQSIAHSLTIQADGKILITGTDGGYPGASSGSYKTAVARHNPDGSLDSSFGAPTNTLDGISAYKQGDTYPSILDGLVQIADAELESQGNYKGASITLQRHGGANSEDVFSCLYSPLKCIDNKLMIAGAPDITIGSYLIGNGIFRAQFNSNASQYWVNQVLSLLSYSNTSTSNDPKTIQIDWIFNDGNTTGIQGTGGALKTVGTTTTVYLNNAAPVLATPAPIDYVDTAFDDTFLPVTGTLSANDTPGSSLTFEILGTDNGDGTLSSIENKAYGTLIMDKTTGAYSFIPNQFGLEKLNVDKSISFAVSVRDGFLYSGNNLVINISQNGITESLGNDNLTGTSGDDVMIGLTGDDTLSGQNGNDFLRGWEGNDNLSGGNGDDVLRGGEGNDILTGGTGKDIFEFNYAPDATNVDTINDFNPIDDSIRLWNTAFTELTASVVLNSNHFVVASTALDSDDYVIYNKVTGDLFYDADGNGSSAAIKFATLPPNLALTNADFTVWGI